MSAPLQVSLGAYGFYASPNGGAYKWEMDTKVRTLARALARSRVRGTATRRHA